MRLLVWHFNSIKVRLELLDIILSFQILNFNSIKVRLEQAVNLIDSVLGVFQFHKGAIRTIVFDTREHGIINFNSIKVRLEPKMKLYQKERPKFQFHKGAIRTHSILKAICAKYIFQFHKGAIRTSRF